jgi:murein DD-endopeptidase MepM/ murein hydrolase activator NlpD
MPPFNVSTRQRASSQTSLQNWPRVAALVLAGITVAGCSDSGRFGYTTAASRPAPQQDVTGSIAPRSAPTARVVSQPLPSPSQPATVAANGGYSSGAQGLGAYRPGNQSYNSDVTGSVTSRPAAPPAPPKPTGAWTWDGGSPVTVGHGETVEHIAKKYGVPASAILQTNGISNAASIKPGQRLVIPRYVTNTAPQPQPVAQAPVYVPARTAAQAPAEANVHIVAPGESLIGIARHYHVPLTTLAHANNIQPYTKVSIGDRIAVPGGRAAPAPARQAQLQAPVQAQAPRVAQPRTVAVEKVATVPVQNARVATEEPQKTESVVKTAEAAGAMPSFRWPVRGRVIAAFGPKPNGAQNDGINLAVPEGTPIKAADDGVVAYAGNELKGYGNLVLIRHANGFVSAYANASELLVKRGDTIKRGQVIAHAGQTGNVTSPQLHFEIRKGSTPVDPTKYLSGA